MQQVNLFLPEFVPAPARLGLRAVGMAALAMIMLIILISLFLLKQLNEARAVTSELNQKNQAITEAITRTQGDRQAQIDAAARKEGLQKQLELQRQLLADLEQRAQVDVRGFSPLLDALARTPMSQSWLTEIDMRGQQFLLKGETTNAKMLPDWIAALQQNDYLRNKSMSYLQIQPVEQKPGVLQFELGDRLDGAQDDESR